MSTRRTFLMQAAISGSIATVNMDAQAPLAAAEETPGLSRRMVTTRIPHTDLVVSRIAYGCAYLVDPRKPMNAEATAKATRLINTAYDNGITFFDQADVYGQSEVALGEVFKRSPGLRNRIVLQSKGGMVFPDDSSPERFWLDGSHDNLIRSVESSLRRLGTDHLDLFLLHWPDSLGSPDEVASAFDELKRSGKVRYFGVSNHSVMQMDLLRKTVRQPLVANQIPIGLARPDLIAEGSPDISPQTAPTTPLTGAVDYCRLHDLQIQAYSPLRGALLSPSENAPAQTKEAAKTLADMARDKNTSPSALALAWLLRHPAGIVPIIGTTNPMHVAEDCAAIRLTLSREEWYTLCFAANRIPRAA